MGGSAFGNGKTTATTTHANDNQSFIALHLRQCSVGTLAVFVLC